MHVELISKKNGEKDVGQEGEGVSTHPLFTIRE